MEEMPKVAAESLMPVVREQLEEAVKRIMESVNGTLPGELISGSEEAVREIGQELVRAVYEAALQRRITAAEAAFPPSARFADRSAAPEQREAANHGVVRRGTSPLAADVVAFSDERQ